MNLVEALRNQMGFCETERNYRCGVYITTEVNKDIVMKVLNNLLTITNGNVEVRNNSYESFIRYSNGNMIRILQANSSVRGQRYNGIIIDSNINQETIDTIILPCLIPLRLENGTYNMNDDPRNRIHYCRINKQDVIESEEYKQLVFSSEFNKPLYKYQRDMLDSMLYGISFKNNNIKFKKEYECMFYENDYDRPVVEKEVNNDKVLLYEAWGIPKDIITYKTEFINKTKQTYLNIKGEFKNELIGFENDINVHLRIDTDIYDGYEVHVEDGLVTVVLHEIKNDAPVLKDYGVTGITE